MPDKVYSVKIYSPENRACDVLPIEVDKETAKAIGETFHLITHLSFQVVQRSRWEDCIEYGEWE